MQDKEDGRGSAAKPGKPVKAGSKKAAGGAEDAKAGKAADRQRQAQLEMLMMDDNALQDMSRIGNILYWSTCSKLVPSRVNFAGCAGGLSCELVQSRVYVWHSGSILDEWVNFKQSLPCCLLQVVLSEYASTFCEEISSLA